MKNVLSFIEYFTLLFQSTNFRANLPSPHRAIQRLASVYNKDVFFLKVQKKG